MRPDVEPIEGASLAVVIAVIYGVLGPLIGTPLVLFFVEVAHDTSLAAVAKRLWTSLAGSLAYLPLTLLVAYYGAALIAFSTGIIMAVLAYRFGPMPFWAALIASGLVFVMFALPSRLFGLSVPGAAVASAGPIREDLIGLATSLMASVICWVIARPIQRHYI